LSSIKFCLAIYGVFFYFGGTFKFIYFKKYHIFYVNYAYFVALYTIITAGVCNTTAQLYQHTHCYRATGAIIKY